MTDEGFDANDVQEQLVTKGVSSIGAEISVVSGKKNKHKFQVTALFDNGDKKPHRVYVTTERDVTKKDLPTIIKDLRNECIRQGFAHGTTI